MGVRRVTSSLGGGQKEESKKSGGCERDTETEEHARSDDRQKKSRVCETEMVFIAWLKLFRGSPRQIERHGHRQRRDSWEVAGGWSTNGPWHYK